MVVQRVLCVFGGGTRHRRGFSHRSSVLPLVVFVGCSGGHVLPSFKLNANDQLQMGVEETVRISSRTRT